VRGLPEINTALDPEQPRPSTPTPDKPGHRGGATPWRNRPCAAWAMDTTDGLVRGMPVKNTGKPIHDCRWAARFLGRIVKRGGPARRRARPGSRHPSFLPIHRGGTQVRGSVGGRSKCSETGIKVVDLLGALPARRERLGLIRPGPAWAKNRGHPRAHQQCGPKKHGGFSVFAGVGERTRGGTAISTTR